MRLVAAASTRPVAPTLFSPLPLLRPSACIRVTILGQRPGLRTTRGSLSSVASLVRYRPVHRSTLSLGPSSPPVGTGRARNRRRERP